MRIAALALGMAALAGCAVQQSFSDNLDDLRISGRLSENVFQPQVRTLSLNLSDAKTGLPLDATDVQIKAGDSGVIHATRRQRGSYVADVANAQRVNLVIVQNGRTATLALQQR